MIPNANLADIVLIVTAAVLFYAAVNDLKHYKIGNELIALLIGLFVLHTLASDRWALAAQHLALASAVFALLIYFYSRQWMGGGDVKLLAVAFLWTGIECALPFAMLLFLFVSLHAIAARFGWVGSQKIDHDDRPRVAFAPAVAAALIGTFLFGCLRLAA